MKILIAIFALIANTGIYSQVMYDHKIVKQYDSLYKKLPSRVKKEFSPYKKNTTNDNGFAFVTLENTDTLNIDENTKSNSVDVVFIGLDPKTGKPLRPKQKKSKDEITFSINFCYGRLSNDTLFIQVGEPFFGQTILHLIVRNKVETRYNEYMKRDTILKANMADTLTNNLTIPVNTVSLILSDSNFYAGKIIYGAVEIITRPYYKKDVWEENKYFELRQRIKYYFKVPLTQDSKLQL